MAALAAMTLPTLDWVCKRQARKTTRALLHAVTAGMATYQTKTWFVANSPATDPITYRMWDVNNKRPMKRPLHPPPAVLAFSAAWGTDPIEVTGNKASRRPGLVVSAMS